MTRLRIKQGDTWTLSVSWHNPIAGTDPPQPDLTSPVNITGYTAKLQVRQAPGAAAVLSLTSSPAAGLTVTGALGKVDVRASPAQTTVIAPGNWMWELEISNLTDTHTLDGGTLTVQPQITT